MGATPCHFVPSGEEVAHALIDVSVNAAECRSARPVAEVVRPAKQRPVQRVGHFGPRIVVAGHQQIANLCLESLHDLLGRARAQIPKTVRFVTVWSERVAEEVEAFLPSILQRGLGLVECQPEPRHYRLRPRQRFGRTSATEDDEVVGIRDDVCTECFPQSYPARPVRIIVGLTPGGARDIFVRLIGQWLQERLGQPVIIENRPGSGGNIATEAVARAFVDGYTLLLVPPSAAINVTLYNKLNFDFNPTLRRSRASSEYPAP